MRFAWVVCVVGLALSACGSATPATGDCAGCAVDGECVAGTATTACGRGGDACAVCSGDETCQDQACLPPASCNATTCPDGCCDDNDTCQPGTALAECGDGGKRCETCPSGQCTAGVCIVGCDITTCAGCCTAQGVCITAPTGTQCGKNGDACETCAGGLGCSAGECSDSSCLATCTGCCNTAGCVANSQADEQNCGNAGETCRVCPASSICTNGDCVPDDSTLWDLVVLSGQVAATKPDGSAWDAFGGLPDPQLCAGATVDDDDDCGTEADNTLNPVWDAVMIADANPSVIIADRFWTMYDVDVTFNDAMGVCINTIGFSAFDGNVHTFTCTAQTAAPNRFVVTWSVRYKLVRKP